MKLIRFLSILFCIFIIYLLVITRNKKEGFLNAYCNSYTDCISCANASGCAWCPKAKTCLNSTLLKSTDDKCNQMNTVKSAFLCSAEIDDKIPPEAVVSNDILYDYTLYKNQITDKIPPPNIFTTEKVDYSLQDVMSNTNNVRNDLQNYQKELPGIIAASVENQIKPMVKGILSENYYIQGFQDMKIPSFMR